MNDNTSGFTGLEIALIIAVLLFGAGLLYVGIERDEAWDELNAFKAHAVGYAYGKFVITSTNSIAPSEFRWDVPTKSTE